MDAGVGKIVEKLEEKHLLQDTVIIFTADNGMNMGHHGIWGKEMELIRPICTILLLKSH